MMNTMMITALLCGLILSTTVLGRPSHAGMIDESGLKAWEACALCHALNGISRMAKFPKLAGQRPSYIEKQLRDFRKGKRNNDGGQMKSMANMLSEKDITTVARYFGSLVAPKPQETGKRHFSAQKLFKKGDEARGLPACNSCHALSRVEITGAPLIDSQHKDYLAKQLNDFKIGNRANDIGGVMSSLAKLLDAEEIRELSDYIASRPRHLD